MVDQEHAGLALLAHRPHDLCEVRHLGLGQARRRLVHEDETRIGGQRARDAELSLLSVREDGRRGVRAALEPEQGEELAGPPPRLAGRGTDAERGHLDVLARREAGEEPPLLVRPRQPGPRPAVGRPRRDRLTRELDLALGRGVEARDDVDERRLPGAVRADQPDDLVAMQLERTRR